MGAYYPLVPNSEVSMTDFQHREPKAPTSGGSWTPAERELVLRYRGTMTHKGISEVLARAGYDRSPKAIERFFHRLGKEALKAAEEQQAEEIVLPTTGEVFTPYKPIQTSWGAPMLVPRLKSIEFGVGTERVPVAIIPDIHCPFQDMRAIELACKIIEEVKPVALVYLGDNVDWSQISKFDRDPHRVTLTAHEVHEWKKVDQMFWSACGDEIRRYYLLGNHEMRLRRYHCWHPELVGFPGMQFDAILGLDEDFNSIPGLQIVEKEINWRDRFLFKHGSVVRKWGSYTAKAELEKERISGISGHTHRAAQYTETNRGRAKVWTESGCLCDLDPSYMDNPNWQQAISIGWFNGDGKNDYFHIDLIQFVKYQAVALGKFFTA